MSNPTRKPVPVKRTYKLLRPVDPTGRGLVRVMQIRGSKVEIDTYILHTFPAYDGSCTGVRVENLLDEVTYAVCLNGEEHSTCECKGFLRWGHCKHIACLLHMQAAGNLPRPLAHADAECSEAAGY